MLFMLIAASYQRWIIECDPKLFVTVIQGAANIQRQIQDIVLKIKYLLSLLTYKLNYCYGEANRSNSYLAKQCSLNVESELSLASVLIAALLSLLRSNASQVPVFRFIKLGH